MRSVEEVFRRLAIGDAATLEAVSDPVGRGSDLPRLDPRTAAMLRVAALVALGASGSAYRSAVEDAEASGASRADLLAVLASIAPEVGTARVVAAAPGLALASGYDVEAALEEREPTEAAPQDARLSPTRI